MKNWEVLDIIEDEIVFEGTQLECEDWVSTQSDYFTYIVQYKLLL